MKVACKRGDLRTKAYRTESEGREANIMKRVGLWAVGIGVLASVGLLTVAQGFADENDRATRCTLATLKGRYLFAGTGTLFPPAFGVTKVSVDSAAGFHIFNGNGTGQDYATFTINGINQDVPSPSDLTYTLNSDCTGTYTVLGPPGGPEGPSFAIFVSPNGDEMTSIATAPPGNDLSDTPSRRVAPK
jgi:hypothetical protein